MDAYIDITVLPDPEVSAPVLLNNLFAKWHRALVQLNSTELGVSFPNYHKTLGAVMRLHGTHNQLEQLMHMPWLKGLRDYCETSAIQNVPSNASHCQVKRKQLKSAHNKRKRSIAKGWLSPEQALIDIPDATDTPLKLPYLQLNSSSTGQSIKLFIEQKPSTAPRSGGFNTYGLSNTATVPWF